MRKTNRTILTVNPLAAKPKRKRTIMKKIVSILMLLALTITLHGQEKEMPPEGATPKGFTLPKKEIVTLDNGLKLVMVPYGAIPKATINFTVKNR